MKLRHFLFRIPVAQACCNHIHEGNEGNVDQVSLLGKQGCSLSSSANNINSFGLHGLSAFSDGLSVWMPHLLTQTPVKCEARTVNLYPVTLYFLKKKSQLASPNYHICCLQPAKDGKPPTAFPTDETDLKKGVFFSHLKFGNIREECLMFGLPEVFGVVFVTLKTFCLHPSTPVFHLCLPLSFFIGIPYVISNIMTSYRFQSGI